MVWAWWSRVVSRRQRRSRHDRNPARRQRGGPRTLSLELLETRTLLSFIAPLASDTGRVPRWVAAADFPGDGTPDLVRVNEGNDPLETPASVAVLLGNGDGTFQPPREFPAGLRPTSVAVGDLRGNGKVDLVVA